MRFFFYWVKFSLYYNNIIMSTFVEKSSASCLFLIYNLILFLMMKINIHVKIYLFHKWKIRAGGWSPLNRCLWSYTVKHVYSDRTYNKMTLITKPVKLYLEVFKLSSDKLHGNYYKSFIHKWCICIRFRISYIKISF